MRLEAARVSLLLLLATLAASELTYSPAEDQGSDRTRFMSDLEMYPHLFTPLADISVTETLLADTKGKLKQTNRQPFAHSPISRSAIAKLISKPISDGNPSMIWCGSIWKG